MAAEIGAELEAGAEAKANALKLLPPDIARAFAFEPAGCRVLQKALQVADRDQAVTLARSLEGCVVEAIQSPHANFVVQAIISILPSSDLAFMVAEIARSECDLPCHEYGCRIFCRLLEANAQDAQSIAPLVDQAVMPRVNELAVNEFGCIVLEKLLEHGSPSQRCRVIAQLRPCLYNFVYHCKAAYVVEKAIKYGCPDQSQALARDLLALPAGRLADLAADYFGSMVACQLLEQPKDVVEYLHQCLEVCWETVQSTRRGQRFWSKMAGKLGSAAIASTVGHDSFAASSQ